MEGQKGEREEGILRKVRRRGKLSSLFSVNKRERKKRKKESNFRRVALQLHASGRQCCVSGGKCCEEKKEIMKINATFSCVLHVTRKMHDLYLCCKECYCVWHGRRTDKQTNSRQLFTIKSYMAEYEYIAHAFVC